MFIGMLLVCCFLMMFLCGFADRVILPLLNVN